MGAHQPEGEPPRHRDQQRRQPPAATALAAGLRSVDTTFPRLCKSQLFSPSSHTLSPGPPPALLPPLPTVFLPPPTFHAAHHEHGPCDRALNRPPDPLPSSAGGRAVAPAEIPLRRINITGEHVRRAIEPKGTAERPDRAPQRRAPPQPSRPKNIPGSGRWGPAASRWLHQRGRGRGDPESGIRTRDADPHNWSRVLRWATLPLRERSAGPVRSTPTPDGCDRVPRHRDSPDHPGHSSSGVLGRKPGIFLKKSSGFVAAGLLTGATVPSDSSGVPSDSGITLRSSK